jgi:hypothetical protein
VTEKFSPKCGQGCDLEEEGEYYGPMQPQEKAVLALGEGWHLLEVAAGYPVLGWN